MLLLTLSAVATAGYGDARDGLPRHPDRETFFWTNAVRVDPAAFQDDYPCAFGSFQASERTTKPPFLYNADLTEAAEYHSSDMRQDGYFDHDSNDGTRWNVRIGRYYSGSTLGENIAWGYQSPYDAVIGGWMCSSGHRANIMSGSFAEMGAGVSGTYYTQDFGDRPGVPDRAMSIGVHVPEDPGGSVDYYVVWDAGSAPDTLRVVVDGEPTDLEPVIGGGGRAVYGARMSAPGGCVPYYFLAEVDGRTETFPEDGSYGFGNCAWDDAEARWLDEQAPLPSEEPPPEDTGDPGATDPGPGNPRGRGGDDGDDEVIDLVPGAGATTTYPTAAGCACDGAGGPAAGGGPALALALAALARRRRR